MALIINTLAGEENEKKNETKESLWDRRCDRWLGKRDSSGVLVAQSGRKRLMVSVMDGHASLGLQ